MSISQIQPQRNFAIVRQLPDPSDSTTYYVQSVIRYAETDALITTLNLTDKGSRRFVGIWRAIADKSGQGTLISVRTTVYTDSGYATPSTTYSEEIETYLVMQQFNPREIVSLLGPALFERGTTGQDIDYKKIRRIMLELLTEKVDPLSVIAREINTKKIEIPSNLATSQDLEAIGKKLITMEDVKACIPEVEKPEPVDFSIVIQKIEDEFSAFGETLQAILEETQKVPEKIDLSPIEKTLTGIENGDTQAYAKIQNVFDAKIPKVIESFDKLNSTIIEIFKVMSVVPKPATTETPPTITPEQRALEILGMKK